jgi:polysaccharide export outer membrane protein
MRFFLISLALVCLCMGTSAFGQEPPGGTSGGTGTSLDSMGIKEYLLAPGDELEVKFFQQPDLNTKTTVDADGTVSLPFLKKPIQASCRTDKDLAKDVTTAYEKFFKNPQISVRVTGRLSRPPIAVYGAVRDPQRMQALRKVKLNEILSFAGGTTEKSNGTIQIVHTAPVLCPEPGEPVETQATAENDAPKFYLYKTRDIIAGVPEANPYVRPGDVVMALEALPIYVTGSVVSPQGLYLTEGMTLQRALSMVGGPRREAKATAVTIYRRDPETGKPSMIPVDYVAIKKQQKPDITLQAYDIIDVPEANMFGRQRIMQTLAGGLISGMSSAISGPMTYLPNRVIY